LKKIFLIFLLLPTLIFAQENNLVEISFPIQFFMIIFLSLIGEKFAKMIKMPVAIGYLAMGILISPFAFGSIPIPFFKDGIFPKTGTSLPVSESINGFSEFAVMLLLFRSGLETDLKMFIKYAVVGSTISIIEVICTFLVGISITAFFTHLAITDPVCLFMGALYVATSVGLTANILSEKKKMDTPEATIILAAAVIDDVLGIIVLAIVNGMALALKESDGVIDWSNIEYIAFKAIFVWLFFTILGLILSKRIGLLLKKSFKKRTTISIVALGFAFLLGGIFEKSGLSSIIGAYIIGLSLSNTDLSYVIQDKLKTVEHFLIPIFFIVNGMSIDLSVLTNPNVVIFGLVFAFAGIIIKLLSAGGASLLMGFNLKGAFRIGSGMVPRAEVTLAIASIGMSGGFLTKDQFSVAILLVLLTSVAAPFLLNIAFRDNSSGKRGDDSQNDSEIIEREYNFITRDFCLLMVDNFISEMKKEGFFITRIEDIYQIRKDDTFVSMIVMNEKIKFSVSKKHLSIFEFAISESFVAIDTNVKKFRESFDSSQFFSKNQDQEDDKTSLVSYTDRNLIMKLKSSDKFSAIEELINLIDQRGFLENKEETLKEVYEREKEMSTGMEKGIAIPHTKGAYCQNMIFALGVSYEGIDWESQDGEKSKIIVLILAPKDKNSPYVTLLSSIAVKLASEDFRNKLLNTDSIENIYNLL